MSQKREEEETLELKISAPEAIAAALCPDNCKISAPTTAASTSCAGSSAPEPIRPDPSKETTAMAVKPEEKEKDRDRADRLDSEAASMKKAVNRCLCCGKRVGLTGFRCRCGELFCSVHRYTDRHDCSFDYKAAGREAIARENPVVRAAKILKV